MVLRSASLGIHTMSRCNDGRHLHPDKYEHISFSVRLHSPALSIPQFRVSIFFLLVCFVLFVYSPIRCALLACCTCTVIFSCLASALVVREEGMVVYMGGCVLCSFCFRF
ncbi:hypothetical protein P171DRAFT_138570 [Karstenula rhodostoma CBS 690.94]|uniref:Transmembrane protein n=1 Tax=Karstenula rhodostoma CBS 690.94 TaxID=1392251 RepID=A0A9P4UFS0_9PLEO|nr:hypothetical protein P171DRAFT_138570 [Karstenula rhodostoma CBS 690.94]